MRIVFFIPPLRRASGGLFTIYKTAANLSALGVDVAFMGPSDATPGLQEALLHGPTLLPWGSALGQNDIWCIPEGWPNALPVGQNSGARTIVYVQSWIYMLDTLPNGVTWQQLPLEYIAVSRPVAHFLKNVIGVTPLGIVPPVVDDLFFHASQTKKQPGMKQKTGPVRVGWMPRKNKALGEQARRVCELRLAHMSGMPGMTSAPRVEWVTIDKVSQDKVAYLLGSCHIFLSTGFPEGFALPPAEAMAAGCVVVGCTGFGGWDYMRQASVDGFSLPWGPPLDFNLSDDKVGEIPSDSKRCGNGFYTPDGDSLAAGTALAQAVYFAHRAGEDWLATRACAQSAVTPYSNKAQQAALAALLL